jgi:hypothetical protein
MVSRGFRPDGTTTAQQHSLAPVRRVLGGARIAVLDNNKPNAGLLMVSVAETLAARAGGPTPLVLGKNAALPAPDEVMAQIRAEADLVLTGSAD